MKPNLKQSAGSDTASGENRRHKDNMFLRARLKLTGLYVLILAVIVFSFSALFYQSVRLNLISSREEYFAGILPHRHFIEDTLGVVARQILIGDIFVLIVAGGLSYILAGKTLEPIEHSVESQKKFAANASHELRTPLAVIKSDTEVLLRNQHPDKELIQETLRSNLEEMNNMSAMIDNLLFLARIDNSTVLSKTPTDVAKLVRDAVTKIRPLSDAKGVHIIFNKDNFCPVVVNEDSLSPAILNVLQNSLNHTGESGKIEITLEQNKKDVTVMFVDTGAGISKKDLPHVFDRFYKGIASTGTGLGLSIVKESIEQNGGSVQIESEEGKGTTVIFHLPVA